MKPHKWDYLREEIYSSNSGRQQTGTFKITSAIERPRDVFVWILNDARKLLRHKIRLCLILLMWRITTEHLNLVS